MANQTGIFITIKAWLPTGKNLDEQYAALSLVKAAHETSDYAPLLNAAKIEQVQTEQKTRRMDDAPAQTVEQRAIDMANNVYAVAANNAVMSNAVPADADPAIIETPVLDQTDGKDEQPVNPSLGLTDETGSKRGKKAA